MANQIRPESAQLLSTEILKKIEMNSSKCIGCGLCVEECPTGIIGIADGKAFFTDIARCISCGHCAAICPASAIQSSPANPKYFKIQAISARQSPAQQLLLQKRSARCFTAQKIPLPQLKDILSYAEKSPSAKNARKRRYLVIH